MCGRVAESCQWGSLCVWKQRGCAAEWLKVVCEVPRECGNREDVRPSGWKLSVRFPVCVETERVCGWEYARYLSDSYTDTIPFEAPHSYRGTAVKYSYKITILRDLITQLNCSGFHSLYWLFQVGIVFFKPIVLSKYEVWTVYFYNNIHASSMEPSQSVYFNVSIHVTSYI